MQFPPTDPQQEHDPYAAFRLTAFRRYFAGHTALIFGWQMQKAAVFWEIYDRTDTYLNLGLVGAVQFIPFALLAVFAGHVSDTHNRKNILMIAASFNGLVALGLAWNSVYGTANLTYLFLFFGGCARGFQMPARRSFLPRIVPREVFPNAVSWHSSGFETSTMLGPAVGGFLIWLYGGALPIYVINALVLFIFVTLVSGIRYRHEEIEDRGVSLSSLFEGFRFIRKSPVVFAAITLDMLGVLFGGAVALMPVFARDILEVGDLGYGFLLAAPAMGAFTMALIQAHMRPAPRAGRRLLIAVTGFGLVTIGFGLSESFALSMTMLFLMGVCDNISVVIRGVLVQMLTPDEKRGRVSAIDGVFIGTSNELGALESGFVAELIGPVLSVVTGGIGTLLVVMGVAWKWPELRKYGALDSPGP